MTRYSEAYMRGDCKNCSREDVLCYEEGKCLKSTNVTADVSFINGEHMSFEFVDEEECKLTLIAPRSNENQWLKVNDVYINKKAIAYIKVV